MINGYMMKMQTQQHKDDFSLALNNNLCSSELTCDVNLDPTNIKTDCLTNENKQQRDSTNCH